MPADSRIRIVQCLCPQRHCLTATAFDPVDCSDDEATLAMYRVLERLLNSGALDPWCPVCGSNDWHTEVGQTAFATLAEAQPHLIRETLHIVMSRHELKGERN